MNYLVGEGLYMNRGEIILAALRVLFRQHGIEQFRLESVEEIVKTEE